MKNITTYTVTKNNEQYFVTVNISNHASKRYKQRGINCNLFAVASNIMALGTGILKKQNEDIAIIDNVNDFTVIANIGSLDGFKLKVDIITLIDKSSVYVKTGTDIVEIKNLF